MFFKRERRFQPTGSTIGTSDQGLRLSQDSRLSAAAPLYFVQTAPFSLFWGRVRKVGQVLGRLVLMPSAFFGPGTGCRERTA